MGAIPAEIFEGRHYGSIFGTVMLAAILGGAAGPWVAGVLYDSSGKLFRPRFGLRRHAASCRWCAIWLARPDGSEPSPPHAQACGGLISAGRAL